MLSRPQNFSIISALARACPILPFSRAAAVSVRGNRSTCASAPLLSALSMLRARSSRHALPLHSRTLWTLPSTVHNARSLSVLASSSGSLHAKSLISGRFGVSPAVLHMSAARRYQLSVRLFSSLLQSEHAASAALATDKSDDPDAQARIAYWLFACCAIVFGIVVLGGATRLTRSGLSMVDWKPFSIMPPTSDAEWAVEFDRYKGYPEYQELGREMPLSEFKFIYYMEFSHRLLGRVLGVFFGVPALVLASRGYLKPAMMRRFGLLFGLGAVQASVGWWMVKSGLETTVHSYNDLPRVSPYRLATHLTTAFVIYSLLLVTGMQTLSRSKALRLMASMQHADAFAGAPRHLRIAAILVAKLVALTAVSGAFVAGNEAGLVHSDFPLMGGQIIPADLINEHIQPAWKNVFENSVMVQFNHRYLAMFTAATCVGLYFVARRAVLPVQAVLASKALIGMAGLQVSLGIATLMLHVPVSLAAVHQGGSLALLSFALWFAHALRPLPITAAAAVASRVVIAQRAKTAADVARKAL